VQVGSCSYFNSLREPAPNLATSIAEPVNDGLEPGAQRRFGTVESEFILHNRLDETTQSASN
jgi:hypothetical protein